MSDKRKKATMNRVQKEIGPFIKKHVFGRDTVDAKHISQIAVLLLNQYNNVTLSQGVHPGKNGKLWLKIKVKSFLFSEEKVLEVTGAPKKKKDDLDWIDHMEYFEAFMDD
ncbi:MAG: hypothetical protein LUE23_12665 [Lachnospiraceae bacterium]|nr:hypothetical protein [Lachnospiraceae bacterium]